METIGNLRNLYSNKNIIDWREKQREREFKNIIDWRKSSAIYIQPDEKELESRNDCRQDNLSGMNMKRTIFLKD